MLKKLTLYISFFALVNADDYSLHIPDDGYVEFGNLSNFLNNEEQFSVSFWFKVDSDQEMRISDRAACDGNSGSNGCHTGFEFFVGQWGLSFRLIDTWSNNMLIVRETNSLSDNSWHHIAATYSGNNDASGISIYLDGELIEVSTHYNSLTGSSVNDLPLRIGGNGEDSGGQGFVDEVSLWLYALTQEEIQEAKAVKMEELKHPEKDEDRAKNPEWLVMLGVCTHLGCVPLDQKGDYNGWFCPCHGSHYDISGRIRKGPAPTNMEIPEYNFVNSNTIKIG